MPNDLPDDELLDVPLANLQPGELSRVFQVQAVATEKKQEKEIEQLRSISALQRGQDEETKHEHEEFEHREAALLASLQEREWQTALDSRELDTRTIKLHDGRRAYVDGDRYRDEQGRELHDADRAEAGQHHLEQPHAATWQEHEEIKQRRAEDLQLRQKVQALDENDPNVGKLMSGYERELQSSHDTRAARSEKLPDYGSGDYMAELGGISATFGQASSGTAPGKPATALPTVAPTRSPPAGALTP